jgi:site-specific DNA-methyltransferase (adenine-specific)
VHYYQSPYFGHRTYSEHNPDEIGREDDYLDYIQYLADIFNVLKLKLRDDGLLWLNLGDTYREKYLLGLPWRVALALQDYG